MPKIKLTSKSMKNFTGNLGTVAFENGVSTEDASQAEVNRLAALTSVEYLDDEGGAAGEAGLQAGMARGRGVAIAPAAHSERGAAEPHKEEINAPDLVVNGQTPKKDQDDEAVKELEQLVGDEGSNEPEPEPLRVYTEDELKEIADSKGISGLREIGNKLDVKDNSIAGLMKEILNAQQLKG